MPQSDGQVQNAYFPAFRTDLNDNLAALFSQSSGASAPAVTQPFQPWIDTSTSPATWYIRNAANTGWITIGTIDATTFSTGGVTAIANGGTGQTTATAALTALLPSQAGNAGKALVTDGSLAGWGAITTSQVFQFDASGTWTKPSVGTGVLVILWGGGGGGNTNAGAWGGGGGACVHRIFRLSDLPSTVSITVGNGGATNSTGGTSSFGSLINAYGGASASGGGGGGGNAAAGSGSNGGAGSGSILAGANAGGSSNFGGAGGSSTFGGSSYWGGGGGGATGGTSLCGGKGGNTSVNGSVPGGGGGSGATSGGAGRCLIYVW